jgi:hypothetical protein
MSHHTHGELTTLSDVRPATLPDPADVMTVLEGALRFQVEGGPARVLEAGETLWEPGGDVIHLEAANAAPDAWTRFVVVMVSEPCRPMLIPVEPAELAA